MALRCTWKYLVRLFLGCVYSSNRELMTDQSDNSTKFHRGGPVSLLERDFENLVTSGNFLRLVNCFFPESLNLSPLSWRQKFRKNKQNYYSIGRQPIV